MVRSAAAPRGAYDFQLIRRLRAVGRVSDAEFDAARAAAAHDRAEGVEDGARGGAEVLELETVVSAAPSEEELRAMVAKEAVDLIVFCEISSRRYYERRLEKPTWPGGASGVTIGVGYDIGHQTEETFRRDWAPYLAKAELDALAKAVGAKSQAAKELTSAFASISVKFDDAYRVFEKATLPRYAERAFKAFPNAAEIGGKAFGALVSLVFNRGASMRASDSRREMRAIRDLMTAREFDKIPSEFRSMKRLWEGKGLPGLIARREQEAQLFEAGLEDLKRRAEAVGIEAPTAGNLAPEPRIELESAVGEAPPPERGDPLAEAVADALEALSPKEKAPAEPSRELESVGAALDADLEGYDEALLEELAEQYGPRRGGTLEAAGPRDWTAVSWAVDGKSVDYAHLGAPASALAGASFEFTVDDLELLIRANRFAPAPEGGRIVFALRGATLMKSLEADEIGEAQVGRRALWLRDARPDHRNFRCVIGVYEVSTGRLSGFAASTVPNAVNVFASGPEIARVRCNLLGSGCHVFEVGWHSSKSKRVPAALVERPRRRAIFRSRTGLGFDREDPMTAETPGDNIHPAFSVRAEGISYSSQGCLTIRGTVENPGPRAVHLGDWGGFVEALGVAPQGDRDHGRAFSVVLLTGLEAATAADLRRAERATDEAALRARLIRLRQGSRDPKGLDGRRAGLVTELQKRLGVGADGLFGARTAVKLAEVQRTKLGYGDGVYSIDVDRELGFELFEPIKRRTPLSARPTEPTLESIAGRYGPEDQAAIDEMVYEIGVLATAARRDPSGRLLESDDARRGLALEGAFDDFFAIGERILRAAEERLQAFICGDDDDAEPEERRMLREYVEEQRNRGEERFSAAIQRALDYVGVGVGPIGALIARVIVKRIAAPIADEIGRVVYQKLDGFCAVWARSLRRRREKAAPSGGVGDATPSVL